MRSNPSEQMCDAFRRLMTHDFYVVDPDTGEVLEGAERDRILALTKPWRNDLWKAFQPLDDGLNPIRAFHAGRLSLNR
ncbi:hypothetical protein KABACHOK_00580 [Brevundimonas phage vB_BpoS-Kabachok]|uniref:Uncharacterized protein n=3 Tax=Marchewkavirus TaxID=3425052 RepID=A0A9E7MPX3_9CAUD|nr:hypothetical protein KABACHOK_00580 [Brevundimonas phage vB_BpoS-Kabachok]USN14591.1 hypothetical protein DOMOVOI_01170 [Brevundimonas phage vB_BpoS-Domovoi]UTC28736.1 hypothetical protein MARCHEWKA_02240 [Brevundimonas phage vB_BpoS-Marchewka]